MCEKTFKIKTIFFFFLFSTFSYLSLLSAFCNLFFYKLKDLVMGLAFISHQCFFFFFLDEKAILCNILLLFGGPLTTGGLRRWPKWPIGSACTAYHAPRDTGTNINFNIPINFLIFEFKYYKWMFI